MEVDGGHSCSPKGTIRAQRLHLGSVGPQFILMRLRSPDVCVKGALLERHREIVLGRRPED